VAQTLNELLQDSMARFSGNPALAGKVEGAYSSISYGDLSLDVRRLVSGLLSLGIKKGDHIALISENRPEWAIADIAMLHIGAVNVAMFPTLPAIQIQYIISDSGSKTILLSGKEQLRKALEVRKTVKDLTIVTMDCPPDPENGLITYGEVLRRGDGRPLNESQFESLWRAVQPNDWASIIYTSGTTGEPKGAILSHQNFTSNVEAGRRMVELQPGDTLLSLVPLNHVMGRLVDHYLALSCGCTVAFVENLLHLRQNIEELSPHYMVLVPRVLEMFHQGILSNVAKEPHWAQRLFNWAYSVGARCCARTQSKQAIPLLLALQWLLADKLVFRRIRNRMGLQRLKFFFSGGAPLHTSTAEFCCSIGLPVVEGYGLTETSPLVAVNPPQMVKFGTVGVPVYGVEIRIAEDGEILVRGPNVMLGYYNKPAESTEAVDPAGWFHTGDIGEFDDDGYLKITDRKKNLLVLSNGKKVAPQPIEMRMLESSYISQIILLGDKQSTLAALVVPLFQGIVQWAQGHETPLDARDTRGIAGRPDVNRLIRDEIERLSTHLADFEKIRRFSLIDKEFSVGDGTLTPTFKVRRSAVLEKYKTLIEEMYR
jgi:long-chain acyl-CoA synthetase